MGSIFFYFYKFKPIKKLLSEVPMVCVMASVIGGSYLVDFEKSLLFKFTVLGKNLLWQTI